MIVLIEGTIERIERMNTEPLDLADIAKFWKVYTTTKRRLLDPTAERLENYWWRIWGSRRRQLNGATVARLFAHISDGESFVPLRGAPSRDEGSPSLEINPRAALGASSATAFQRPSPNHNVRPSTNPSINTRTLTVMPPPILKKTRGPSTGPRPTARFVSPHESENEADSDSGAGSSSRVISQSPSPVDGNTRVDKKSSSTSRKKAGFVATSATRKKRPVIVRRQNSQSSVDKVPSSIASTQVASGKPPSVSPDSSQGRGKQSSSSKFLENFSPDLTPAPKERTTTRPDSKRSSPRQSSTTQPVGNPNSREAASEKQSRNKSSNSKSTKEKRPARSSSADGDRNPPQLSRNGTKENEGHAPQRAPISRSSGTHHDGMEILHHDRKGTASLAPTLTAATGLVAINDRTNEIETGGATSRPNSIDKGKDRAKSEARHEDIFAKRPVPPISSPSTSEPLGSLARSKSQLTMLLEKDHEDRAKNAVSQSPNGKKR
ncbi:hypothetical protein BJ875DRAFT_131095 [Amylocarpus encephaloides]|uniref:Nitrogen regulatory protein areA GATA-like domain-containing protein n=1 Tax=Amylocarpus encephaloides TaxID=45428 RepID=A0A9P7YPY0_9HELO|nr:hypothetical protein BJ875DRAFT_131095 [Amylocarpus encephaloides]